MRKDGAPRRACAGRAAPALAGHESARGRGDRLLAAASRAGGPEMRRWGLSKLSPQPRRNPRVSVWPTYFCSCAGAVVLCVVVTDIDTLP